MIKSPSDRAADAVFVAGCILILAFLIVPTLLVVPMSFSATSYLRFPPSGFSWRWYQAYLADSEWIAATVFSLKIAALTTIAATILGAMAAFALVRGRLPGRETINALILAPLVVPHIVLAIAIYLQFGPLGLNGTTIGFVAAHSALAAPYVVIIVAAALTRVDPTLEMAALNLGASRLRSFLEVTMPLVSPAIYAGAVFAFLSSFDETIVSFFISGTENKTLTRKLFEDIDFNLSPVIAAVSTMIIAVTIAVMALAQWAKYRGEKRTALASR